MTRPPHCHDQARPVRPISTLFCPHCGHESRVDGDWIVKRGQRRCRYRCPTCDARIADRPRSATVPATEPPSVRVAAAWGRLVVAPVTTWRDLYASFVSSLTGSVRTGR